jgi:hypothetical protein
MLPYRDSRFIRIVLVLFFVLLIAYALYEAQGLLFGPSISVPEDIITVHEAFIYVSGRAERISELRMNGAPIAVTEAGEFREPYVLIPGSNYVLLEARDSRNRKASERLEIVYQPL